MKSTLTAFAAAHAGGAVVIDVREPFEYVAGHVPGARLVPLARLSEIRSELPRSEPVYVICASGNRSLAAADFLARAGIQATPWPAAPARWTRAGKPVVYGAREHAA